MRLAACQVPLAARHQSSHSCGNAFTLHPPPSTLHPPPSMPTQALQSVLSKQALADGCVSKPELFCVAAQYALLLLLPLFALLEAWRLPR